MSKLLLVIGICQVVVGVVVVGLVGKSFYDTTQKSNDKAQQIDAFGPVLIGLLVVVNGVFGILTTCCSSNKKMDVFYLIGATVAASASAAMVWIYSLLVYDCERRDNILNLKVCFYSEETQNIHITLLVFSIACCAMSVFGMVSSSLTTCRKL